MTKIACAPMRKRCAISNYNRGLCRFLGDRAVGELNDSTNEYNINFTVSEGERYSYGSIEIDSTIPGVDVAGYGPVFSKFGGRPIVPAKSKTPWWP